MTHYLRHAGRYFTRSDKIFLEADEPPPGATVVVLGDRLVVAGGGSASVPTAKTMRPVDIGEWASGTLAGTYVERDTEDHVVRVEVCVLIDQTADRKRNRLIGSRVWAGPEDVRVTATEEVTARAS